MFFSRAVAWALLCVGAIACSTSSSSGGAGARAGGVRDPAAEGAPRAEEEAAETGSDEAGGDEGAAEGEAPAESETGAATETKTETKEEEAELVDPLVALRDATPRCDPAARHCFGLHLHVVVEEEGAPVQSLEWVTAQVAGAQDRFAEAADASFEVVAVDALPAARRDVVSRLDRDTLGRPHFSRGVVHVFVVGSLADVDGPGEIRGVHWRDRVDTARRWVILSSIAGSMTLTHELGHFFSLPHSRYAGSIMNKRPGDPPFAERRFHAKEAAKMRRAKAAMIGDGMLAPRAAEKAEAGAPGGP
ncbi:MAG: hypothetical protein R3A79_03170 [Nannocystaceae bacterium]